MDAYVLVSWLMMGPRFEETTMEGLIRAECVEHYSRTTSDGGLAKGQCIGPRGTIFPDLLRLAVVAGAQRGVMSNRTILWLLAMIVGLGLLFWLFPPHEIERRLEREKMGARQSRGS
jgi:hypothetical protein